MKSLENNSLGKHARFLKDIQILTHNYLQIFWQYLCLLLDFEMGRLKQLKNNNNKNDDNNTNNNYYYLPILEIRQKILFIQSHVFYYIFKYFKRYAIYIN